MKRFKSQKVFLSLLRQEPDNHFMYILNSVKSIFKIDDPATSVSILKLNYKTHLFNKQLLRDAEN